jgi:hypothetical protein
LYGDVLFAAFFFYTVTYLYQYIVFHQILLVGAGKVYNIKTSRK